MEANRRAQGAGVLHLSLSDLDGLCQREGVATGQDVRPDGDEQFGHEARLEHGRGLGVAGPVGPERQEVLENGLGAAVAHPVLQGLVVEAHVALGGGLDHAGLELGVGRGGRVAAHGEALLDEVVVLLLLGRVHDGDHVGELGGLLDDAGEAELDVGGAEPGLGISFAEAGYLDSDGAEREGVRHGRGGGLHGLHGRGDVLGGRNDEVGCVEALGGHQ